MKILLYSLAAAVLLVLAWAGTHAARLCRYEILPLSHPGEDGRRLLCLRHDRLTGAVEIGREYTMGPPDGRRLMGLIWEPLEGDLTSLINAYNNALPTP